MSTFVIRADLAAKRQSWRAFRAPGLVQLKAVPGMKGVQVHRSISLNREPMFSSSPRLPLLLTVVSIILATNAGLAKLPEPCEQITKNASVACEAATRNDYATALGKCNNISDPAAQTQCRQRAAAELEDAVQTCRQQDRLRAGVCDRLGGGTYEPIIDPANFVTVIDNLRSTKTWHHFHLRRPGRGRL